MPRAALDSRSIDIEQNAAIIGDKALKNRKGQKVRAEQVVVDKDYLDQLKFYDEPVTIRLEPTAEKHAPTSLPVWVNGKGAEVFLNGGWVEATHLPVGIELIIKRKALAVIAGAKVDQVETEVRDKDSERPVNLVKRHTSVVSSFTVLEDRNPMGAAWLTELRRRNH